MKYPSGLIGWVDLVTADVPGAKEFYGTLFGWEHFDLPTPMGPAYTQFTKDGKVVAGCGPIPPGFEMPSVWNSYVLVEDADATLAKVEPNGGRVLMPAMDVMEQGRMAMVMDPSGAAIGVWQPKQHEGAELFNAPGALTWNELQSKDIDAALPFYAEVFGWQWAPGPSDGYFIANLPSKPGDDKSNGGGMGMPPGVPDEVPSFWMVYFAVEDCEAALATGLELGGSVLFPPMQMGPGTFAGLRDPQGSAFAVFSF